MRKTGRRTLAAVAAGALGAGLLIGLGATPANAAVTGPQTGVVVPAVNSSQGYVVTQLDGAGGATAAVLGLVQPNATVTLSTALRSTDDDDTVIVSVTSGGVRVPIVGTAAGGAVFLPQADDTALFGISTGTGAAITGTGTVRFNTGAPGTVYTVNFATDGAGGAGTTATFVASGSITGVSNPAAARAGGSDFVVEGVAFAGTRTAVDDTTAVDLAICAIGPLPAGAIYTAPADVTAAAAIDAGEAAGSTAMIVPLGSFNLPGTYQLGLFYRGNAAPGGDVCNNAANGVATAASQLRVSFNQTYGGQVAAVTQTPATAALVPGATQTMTVTATDAGGRRTLPTGTDSIAVASSTPAVATVGALGIGATTGTMTYTTTAVAAGAAVVSATPSNATVTPATSTIAVLAAGETTATTQIALDQANVADVTDPAAGVGNIPWNLQYDANLTVNSLSYQVSGLVPGATYRWTATPTVGSAIRLNSGTAAAAAAGTLTADDTGNATVAVTVTGQVATNTVTFRVLSTGVNGNTDGGPAGFAKTNTVTFAVGAAAFQTPGNGSIVYGTASQATPIAILVEDQYGTPFGASAVAITPVGATTPVATGTTNSSGAITLSVTAPASGSTVFNLTGATAGNVAIPAVQFTVTVTPPTLTFASGVTTSSNTVSVNTPADAFANTVLPAANAEVTRIQVNVRNAGVPVTGAAVSFTGSEGVQFFTTAPLATAAWNSGSATPLPVASVGGVATIWAYSTKTGTATVTATVAGVSAEGQFQVNAVNGDGRNVEIDAPTEVETGAFGVVTLTVTDEFGNAASGQAVDLRFDDASPGRFGNGQRQTALNVDAAGKVQVTVTAAPGESGQMRIRVANGSAGDQFGAAANRLRVTSAVNDAPGFAASNAPKTVEIEIKPGAGSRSITIAGVRDGNRIEVAGETLGLADGTVVRPWLRFPGQTGFTEGSAQRTVSIVQGERGEFEWGRKTGKRTAVQFRTGDDLRSNTILIPAR